MWEPTSWRNFEALQQPIYPDSTELSAVLAEIRRLPPLVFVQEIRALKKELAQAARGQRFILQGGDCAEKFSDCTETMISSKVKILLQMATILAYGTGKPITRIGRIAGQYGKPRSQQWETIDGCKLPVFRGDNVNSIGATLDLRRPDPKRLVVGYHLASLTLNYIRAFSTSGFTNIQSLDQWNLDFIDSSKYITEYQSIVSQVKHAMRVLKPMDSRLAKSLRVSAPVPIFTSHEGLILGLEEAFTRYAPAQKGFYNLSAHLIWIGDRTRCLTGSHVEYCRGIENPIGIKVGPSMEPEEVCRVITTLNPSNEEGKIAIIARFGKQAVKDLLPALIDRVTARGLNVCWFSDPMHGNAIVTDGGIKTRDFNDVLEELRLAFAIHRDRRVVLGGVHFEMTGEDVTECVGGSEGLGIEDLSRNYESYCDPRLNYRQSLEMAFIIATLAGDQSTTFQRN